MTTDGATPADQALLEMPLRRAAVRDDDFGADWIETLPVLMQHYQGLTVDAYWNLTVAEALAMLQHLVHQGIEIVNTSPEASDAPE